MKAIVIAFKYFRFAVTGIVTYLKYNKYKKTTLFIFF